MVENSPGKPNILDRAASIIGWVMLVSLFIYALIVEALFTTYTGFKGFAPDMPMDILRYVLWGASLLLFVVIFVIRAKFAPDERAADGITKAPKPEELQKRFGVHVINLTLAESCAVFGLVLFLVGGERMDFYTMALASMVLIVVIFPRRVVRQA